MVLRDICTALGIAESDLFAHDNRSAAFGTEPPTAHENDEQDIGVRDWNAVSTKYVSNLTEEKAIELCTQLGLPFEAIDSLPGIGWSDEGYWTFPERDGNGKVIGILKRLKLGRKLAMLGSKRGLTLPAGWRNKSGSIYNVKGASDTLALTYTGMKCIGRPSNSAGSDHLITYYGQVPHDVDIVFVGENDQKEDGSWPGRAGVIKVAQEVADGLQRSVKWTLPPKGFKDCRAWLIAPEQAELTWQDRGRLLSDHLLQSKP